MTPAWIVEDAWRDLHPPAEVLVLGELPRTPEKLLGLTRALCVPTAKRYQPVRDPNGVTISTECNIFAGDACQIARAPLPHWYDLGDGRGRREMTANDYVDGLRDLKFPGWSKLGTVASAAAVATWASEGKLAVAVWKNLTPRTDREGRVLTLNGRPVLRSGHITVIVPTPAGHGGVYTTGAGANCVQEVPLQFAFGHYVGEVEFFGHP